MSKRKASWRPAAWILLTWGSLAWGALASSGRVDSALAPLGEVHLRILSEKVAELSLVTERLAPEAGQERWKFLRGKDPRPPQVQASHPLGAVGFRRRVLYAPLKPGPVRVGNYLELSLSSALTPGESLRVSLEGHVYQAVYDPTVTTPVIHACQGGYAPEASKLATVGYYLGSLGSCRWATGPSASWTVGASPCSRGSCERTRTGAGRKPVRLTRRSMRPTSPGASLGAAPEDDLGVGRGPRFGRWPASSPKRLESLEGS